MNVLKFVAALAMIGGAIAGLILFTRGSAWVGLGLQVIAGGFAGGFLWLVMARVLERLDQMAEVLERMAGE